MLEKWGRILALEIVYKDFAKCLGQFLSFYYTGSSHLYLFKALARHLLILPFISATPDPDLTALSDAIPTYLSLETACLIALFVWLVLKMH